MFGNIRNYNEKINKLTIIPYHIILNNVYLIFNNKLLYFLLNNNIKHTVGHAFFAIMRFPLKK